MDLIQRSVRTFYVEVFGVYDTATKKLIAFPVEDRKRATLLPIIKWCVPRGTQVTSDQWGAYNTLPRHGYRHLVVVHKR